MLNFEWDSLKNFQFGSNKFRRPYAGPKWKRAVSKVFFYEFSILNVFSHRGYVIADISGSAVARASLESRTEDYGSLITLHRELYWYLTPIRNRTLIFFGKIFVIRQCKSKSCRAGFYVLVRISFTRANMNERWMRKISAMGVHVYSILSFSQFSSVVSIVVKYK